MAFLFKSKKHHTGPVPPSSRDGPTSNGVSRSKDGEKDRTVNQTPTPASSVHNSLSGGTPSPEQKNVRERQDSEPQAPRNPTGPTQNPNASLYPWSNRRLTFPTTHPSPFPRYGAAANAVSSKEGDIYIMGGLINGSIVKGDLWMLEAGGSNLACYPIATTSEGPGPRVGHASLLVSNAYIIFGGDTKLDDKDVLDDTLYLLNTSTRQWTKVSPPGPKPAGRYGHTVNLLGSKIYVFGGQVEDYYFNDLMAFDLSALNSPKWETLVPNSPDASQTTGPVPPARTNHTIVTFNDKLYLFGGTNGEQWFNDVWSFDPRTNNWSVLECIGYIPAPREGHASALVNDVMYIFGGRTEEGNDLGDLAAFRISTRRWYTFQNMGPSPSPRSGHTMTAYGKQIVVVGGEPGSAPRDAGELSLSYILDTGKIRYPNDQPGPQPRPVAERAPGARRPSGGEKPVQPQNRIQQPSKEELRNNVDDVKRVGGAPRESVLAPQGPQSRDPDPNQASGPGGGVGSRLPRASLAQAPSGPPPQQQAPAPRVNGALPPIQTQRSKTPTRSDKAPEPLDQVRAASLDKENRSPVRRESPPGEFVPITNERSASAMQSRPLASPQNPRDESPEIVHPPRSRSRQIAGEAASNRIGETQPDAITDGRSTPATTQEQSKTNSQEKQRESVGARTSIEEPRSDVQKELELLKSKAAWYASELALARKAGYLSSGSSSPLLEERGADFLSNDDRPLVEAFMTMRAELVRVQNSLEAQSLAAAQRVAEIEKQRDVAVSEAVYAKAKLAAQGGSQTGTPQPDSAHETRNGDFDRFDEISRRLASALAAQTDLRTRLEAREAEVQTEKQAREIAEDMAGSCQKRLSELDIYKQQSSQELESVKADLLTYQRTARDEAANNADAQATMKLLKVDNEELKSQLDEATQAAKIHSDSLASLRETVSTFTAKVSFLERKLEEERDTRKDLDREVLELKHNCDQKAIELESLTKKLRETEELAEAHAAEARAHRQTIEVGFSKITESSSPDTQSRANDDRLKILQQQLDDAVTAAQASHAAADSAFEKLRRAEERIAGLEAYQEQASREGVSIRKQLQTAIKDAQTLRVENTDLRQSLESHQLEANALAVQHGALKDLLNERSPNGSELSRTRSFGSGGSRFGTPDQLRLRELEQQLETSLEAQRTIKSDYEAREQEAEKLYQEKLEQLENDYRSAVHYVNRTQHMLTRMKDELSKSKAQNEQLQSDLEEAQKSGNSQELDHGKWEQERESLKTEIEQLQEKVHVSVTQLENQLHNVRAELEVAKKERDENRANLHHTEHELTITTEKMKVELDQLKDENALLESRAMDAEQKVSMLLDQVESSVDNYRRQSHQFPANGGPGHQSKQSNHSMSQESAYGQDNRNSVALDSLASELDALRSHWETTNKNYRLSSTSEFDKPAGGHEGGELSNSLANWRKKLDLEDMDEEEAAQQSIAAREIGNHSTAGHASQPNMI